MQSNNGVGFGPAGRDPHQCTVREALLSATHAYGHSVLRVTFVVTTTYLQYATPKKLRMFGVRPGSYHNHKLGN